MPALARVPAKLACLRCLWKIQTVSGPIFRRCAGRQLMNEEVAHGDRFQKIISLSAVEPAGSIDPIVTDSSRNDAEPSKSLTISVNREESRKKRPKVDGNSPVTHSPSREQKKRPTHFIAARVSLSFSVVEAMKTVQEALIIHTPALHGALADPVSAHLTLMVMPLDGEDGLQAARKAMVALQAALQDVGQRGPFPLEVAGLSHFRRQVLYLDVVRDDGHDRLVAIAAAARSHFVDAGIADGDDGRPFTAHITVAKLSNLFKGSRQKRGAIVKSIPEEAYADLMEIRGGSFNVSELQLCRMQGREKASYYHVEASITL